MSEDPYKKAQDQIREELIEGLKQFKDEDHGEDAHRKVRDFIYGVLERQLPITEFVGAGDVKVTIDKDDPSLVRITMPVPVSTLEDMTRSLYDEGKTHEEVTAWLEKAAPNFRDVLSECICVERDATGAQLGSEHVRWMQLPPHIFLEIETKPTA